MEEHEEESFAEFDAEQEVALDSESLQEEVQDEVEVPEQTQIRQKMG